MEQRSYPVANTIEEPTFNLAALASRDGPVLDLKDWFGAELGQFTDTRKSGWPLLDLTIRPPGNVNVIVQLGTAAATFFDWFTQGVVGGTWGEIRIRIPGRFARVRVTDTSNAANNAIYLWTRLASQ